RVIVGEAMIDLDHRERVAQRAGDGSDVLGRQPQNGAVRRRDVVVLRRVFLETLGGAEEEGPVRDERPAERSAVELALEFGLLRAPLLRERILGVEAGVTEEPVSGP